MKNTDKIVTAGHADYNIVTFSWYVTDYCNFRCTYCAEGCRLTTDKEQCANEMLAYKIILKRICNKNVGDFSVELIGGEPTMSLFLPDILTTLDSADNCRYYELITNLSKPMKYFKELLTDRSDKMYLKPSFHPEYYKVSFIEKILTLSGLCNVRPTIMLSDNNQYWDDTTDILDTLIHNNIEFDLQTIYTTDNYEPVYTESFHNRFDKYFNMYKRVSFDYKIDFHLDGMSSDIPYTTNAGEHTVNVNDIKKANLHMFKGYKCKALYWQIDPSGRIFNSCTNQDLKYDYKNIRSIVTCPVQSGCVEKHKLFYHKTNEQ